MDADPLRQSHPQPIRVAKIACNYLYRRPVRPGQWYLCGIHDAEFDPRIHALFELRRRPRRGDEFRI
jgi:hypothetical protein